MQTPYYRDDFWISLTVVLYRYLHSYEKISNQSFMQQRIISLSFFFLISSCLLLDWRKEKAHNGNNP